MASINKREGLSFIQYESDGVQLNYTFSFRYISKDYVSVRIGDTETFDYVFVNDNEIRLGVAAPLEAIVTIRRDTNAEQKLVDFVDGGIITERLLDTQFDQVIDLVQEAKDVANSSVFIDINTMTGDAGGARLIDLGDPVDDKDAANKRYVDGVDTVNRTYTDGLFTSFSTDFNNKLTTIEGIEDDINAIKVDYDAKYVEVVQIGADSDAALLSIAATEAAVEADKVQTGLDAVTTAADRVQTGLDRVATGADRVAVEDAKDLLEPMVSEFPAVKSDVNDLKPRMTAAELAITNLETTILDDVVTKTGTQTLTNKTIQGASIETPIRSDYKQDTFANLTTYALTATNGQAVWATDTKTAYNVRDGQLTAIGSGSGGGINYVTDPMCELATTAWSTYADAAGTAPVDGTGGSPSITVSNSTSSPLRGLRSLVMVKDAANRQGQGISIPFTIDVADKTKVLQVSFDYGIASGTYADNDVSFWIYDVTNSALIQPAPYLLKNAIGAEKMSLEFQASTSTSYRLIAHIASTSALAYSLQFDNLFVGRQAKNYGSPTVDAVAKTFTLINAGNATITGTVARQGSNAIFRGKITIGSTVPAGGALGVILPSGYALKYSANFLFSSVASGISGVNYTGLVYSQASTSVIGFVSSAGIWGVSTPAAWVAGNIIEFEVMAEIEGWSSSTIMSSDADTRVVALSAYLTTGYTASGVIKYDTILNDTHGGYSTSTGLYTVKVPGFYRAGYSANVNGTAGIELHKNGSSIGLIGNTPAVGLSGSGSKVAYFNAGETISLSVSTSYTFPSSTVTTQYNSISIERLSGPSQIAASESVSALYTGAPPAGTLAGSFNTITFGSKVKDSHNAYSGGVYTVPVSGAYDISTKVMINATYSLNQESNIAITIDDSAPVYTDNRYASAGILYLSPALSVTSIPLLAGQKIRIKTFSNGASPAFIGAHAWNYFSITRTGNY